ncbi:hypothetical protein CBR_g17885 [Chara braunii]|uniref:Aminotransferase class I/classII large domain-containing protein n=1 Tax=Chara braunii TaxID=69332 RepID=A0A388KVU6_CHABU|nr:hypothetical protein CBR_g17885 [Chara braunii]|eukprot:GBG74171.1 hypothetical protein CBR_g17885 [Chara braunii]
MPTSQPYWSAAIRSAVGVGGRQGCNHDNTSPECRRLEEDDDEEEEEEEEELRGAEEKVEMERREEESPHSLIQCPGTNLRTQGATLELLKTCFRRWSYGAHRSPLRRIHSLKHDATKCRQSLRRPLGRPMTACAPEDISSFGRRHTLGKLLLRIPFQHATMVKQPKGPLAWGVANRYVHSPQVSTPSPSTSSSIHHLTSTTRTVTDCISSPNPSTECQPQAVGKKQKVLQNAEAEEGDEVLQEMDEFGNMRFSHSAQPHPTESVSRNPLRTAHVLDHGPLSTDGPLQQLQKEEGHEAARDVAAIDGKDAGREVVGEHEGSSEIFQRRQPRGMPSSLSSRGSRALLPFSPYIEVINRAKKNIWSPSNLLGYFPMGTAESILTFDLVIDKIRKCRNVPRNIGLYDNMCGGERLRCALARMMERTFMGVAVDPAHICISSGVTAVLDLFFFAVCDPGDGCLIPAPYFPAFDNDMSVRNAVVPIPVQPRDIGTYIPTAEDLENAYSLAEEKGVHPRMLLLTNPGNPLGTLYPEETLCELLVWAMEKGLHVLTDEIYANSKFGEHTSRFVSMAKVGNQAVAKGLVREDELKERVHTAYGMSKDFGLSGFRVGCIHTRNQDLLDVWSNLGMFAAVSTDTQHALAEMLEDDEFVKTYVKTNNMRLKNSYDIFTGALRDANVTFMPACAGMFCWVDLRFLLSEPTFPAEEALWKEMVVKAHVVLTPGAACHCVEPGFFRACYATMLPDKLHMACKKLIEFVDSMRLKQQKTSDGKRKASELSQEG